MIKDADKYQNKLTEQLNEETVNGSHHDDFLALVNISRELLPLSKGKEEIMSLWRKYRLNNEEQNYLRHEPYGFQGFKEIIGSENITSCFEQGGVFATFHFGHYRYVPFQLGHLLNMNKDNSIDIVVDQESFDSELQLTKWNELREEYNVNYIISEENNSGLKLLRILKQHKSFLLYLDGNSGSGDDSNPLEVRHITSLAKIRSGIFRLMQLTKKPLCLVIADLNSEGKPRLKAYKPIFINKENFEEAVREIYSLFRDTLSNQPELWRFWYRHHLYVNSWTELNTTQPIDSKIDWKSDSGLGVDLSTGKVYRI